MGQVMAAAMDDRLREAIMFEKPGRGYVVGLHVFMRVRRWWLRWLALPRWIKNPLIGDEVTREGRRHFLKWDTLPVYIKPTLWNRWGPGAWLAWSMGIPLPGDRGMAPEGFLTKDVGPRAFEGKGYAEAEKTKERLRKERTGGCPFIVR